MKLEKAQPLKARLTTRDRKHPCSDKVFPMSLFMSLSGFYPQSFLMTAGTFAFFHFTATKPNPSSWIHLNFPTFAYLFILYQRFKYRLDHVAASFISCKLHPEWYLHFLKRNFILLFWKFVFYFVIFRVLLPCTCVCHMYAWCRLWWAEEPHTPCVWS